MNKTGIILLLALFSTMCKGANLENGTIKASENPGPLIGYRNEVPHFNEYMDETLYYFDGDFYRTTTKLIKGFYPVFINDSCIIYRSTNYEDNKLIVAYNNHKIELDFGTQITNIVANMNGDTLYFTEGEKEMSSMQIYCVKGAELIVGEKIWYEGLHFTKKGLMYFVPALSDGYTTDEGELYVGSGFSKENDELVLQGVSLILFLSEDGRYTVGYKFDETKYISMPYLIDLNNNKFIAYEEQFYKDRYWAFYFANNVVFYRPGKDSFHVFKNPFFLVSTGFLD